MDNSAQYDIAQRAYQLWERDGRPQGRDQEYWFHAERELIGATTAAEDRPIGEIRQAELASAERRSEKSGVTAAPEPVKEKGGDLAEQLDDLQNRLSAKEATSAKPDARPRAKKTVPAADGRGDFPRD